MTARTADRPRPLHTSRPPLAAIACLGALLGACDDGAKPTAPRSEETPATLETDALVCPGDRVVAITTHASCPPSIPGTGGHWSGGNLYSAAPGLPPALARMCGYQWMPQDTEDPEDPDHDKFSAPHFTSYGKDCEVVWPEADELSLALAEPLKAAFYAHAGRVTGTPPTTGKVVVAVVDTASNSPVQMTSDHGKTMANIVTSMACPNATCGVSLDHSLALPLLGQDLIDWQAGGYYGSQGHLAQAIHGAVKRWKQRNDGSKLVINLSVGWEASKFGGTEPIATMPPPAQAVYRALEYARCEGAVIVAAAGNKAGNECVPGPLAPALWEAEPGPTRLECQNDYGTTPPGTWDPASTDLVHAVAGVAYDDKPLYNARPGSRARLAAPAYAAVVERGGGVTAAMTGSSVAAATVSGVAGLVWSYYPALDPGAVIEHLYDSGIDIGGVADFPQADAVHRVSACEALRDCPGGVLCPVLACPGVTGEVDAVGVAVDDALMTLRLHRSFDRSAHTPVKVCQAGCEDATLISGPGFGTMCRDDRFGGHDRYTNPQPNEAPCKVCVLADNTLYMTIDEAYTNFPIVSAVLDVNDDVADLPDHHVLGGLGRLSSAAVTEVTLRPSMLPGPPRSATLGLTFDFGPAGGLVTYNSTILVR